MDDWDNRFWGFLFFAVRCIVTVKLREQRTMTVSPWQQDRAWERLSAFCFASCEIYCWPAACETVWVGRRSARVQSSNEVKFYNVFAICSRRVLVPAFGQTTHVGLCAAAAVAVLLLRTINILLCPSNLQLLLECCWLLLHQTGGWLQLSTFVIFVWFIFNLTESEWISGRFGNFWVTVCIAGAVTCLSCLCVARCYGNLETV
jgi:hypothetical protein